MALFCIRNLYWGSAMVNCNSLLIYFSPLFNWEFCIDKCMALQQCSRHQTIGPLVALTQPHTVVKCQCFLRPVDRLPRTYCFERQLHLVCPSSSRLQIHQCTGQSTCWKRNCWELFFIGNCGYPAKYLLSEQIVAFFTFCIQLETFFTICIQSETF